MKRLDRLFTIMTVCAVALPAAVDAATPVKNITLAKSGDFTEVTIPVPSHQLCEHFTEPATAERPFRIVLNLCNAEHALPQQNYSNLPACMVKKIRTSQFSTTPESIVRVVLDLRESVTYTVRTEGDRLVVAVADKSPAFAQWEAGAPPVMAKTETPAKPVINPPAAAAPEPASTKPAQSLVLEETKTQTPSTESQSTATVSTEELLGPDGQNAPTVANVQTEQPVATSEPKSDFVLPSQPLVLAPEVLDAAQVDNVASPESPATMPAAVGNIPTVTATGNEPPLLAANPQPTDVTLPATVSSNDTLTGQEALIEKLKSKFFGGQRAPKPYLTEQGIIAEQLKSGDGAFGPPTPGSDMDREALLERIRLASQQRGDLPANMLPSVPGGPVRTEIFYDDLGRRDPFEPLLKGLRSGFVSDELPSVETLRMVGVLKDNDQALALMEDTDGHSYILRPGDPVANGRVLSVGEARTVLQVDEYGWTRTVVLQLTSRGAKPSRTLGARSYDDEPEETKAPATPAVAPPATKPE